MLGSDLVQYLRLKKYSVRALDLPECDITQPAHLEKELSGIDVAVNCAAFTDVDGAEDAPGAATAVNAGAPGMLGELAAKEGIFVVHVSTDFVFDGQSRHPYSEEDVPNPLGVYGQSKLGGEKALERADCPNAIIRVQWSYGAHGTNFVSKLLARARAGHDLKIVDDQVGAPTWTVDIARAIECLVRGRIAGLYHFANGGYASRFEAGCFIARELGLSNRISPCSSDEFPAKARRPWSSRFDTTRIQHVLDHPVRHWRDALRAYLHPPFFGVNRTNSN